MISEKGLCKALKNAYKRGGYGVIPQSVEVKTGAGEYRRNDILINGAAWAVSCLTVALPPEAAVQIVKDVGYLPVEAVKVQKGEANQLMMAGIAAERYDMLQEQRGDVIPMKKIPVIFKDRWQLYQTMKGTVHAFDTELLQLIDKDFEKSCSCFMSAVGHLGIFMYGDSTVYLAPGRFSAGDEEKILHIAGLDWEQQIEHDDPAVNISLFDENEDEPMEAAED